MEKSLADRYPEIKTYRGQGIDDPTAITRFDWTPSGFHAIILSTRGTILIQPESRGDIENYAVSFQEQLPGSFQCGVDTAMQEAARLSVLTARTFVLVSLLLACAAFNSYRKCGVASVA